MTGGEWIVAMGDELKEKGYEFVYYGGLPLVKRETTASFEAKRKFLKERFNTPCTRAIYAEGTLFVPPGLKLEKP